MCKEIAGAGNEEPKTKGGNMTIEEYLLKHKTKLTKSAMMHMITMGIISQRLTDEDRVFLIKLERVWGKHNFLRPQLAKMSKTRRENLVLTADLRYAWCRDLMTRIVNTRLNGKHVILEKLIKEVAEFRPALQRELVENSDFVFREGKRIKRKAERLAERYRHAKDNTGPTKCSTCGRAFRQTY